MSKPDDIPQDIRLIATDLILSGPVSGDLDDVCEFEEAIARAILAAKAEEREACLAEVVPYKHRDTGYDIYQAIRKRGEHVSTVRKSENQEG